MVHDLLPARHDARRHRAGRGFFARTTPAGSPTRFLGCNVNQLYLIDVWLCDGYSDPILDHADVHLTVITEVTDHAQTYMHAMTAVHTTTMVRHALPDGRRLSQALRPLLNVHVASLALARGVNCACGLHRQLDTRRPAVQLSERGLLLVPRPQCRGTIEKPRGCADTRDQARSTARTADVSCQPSESSLVHQAPLLHTFGNSDRRWTV